MEKLMLPCLLKSLTGFDCPGCGFQRALLLLVKGDFIRAFHMYPPVYTMVAFALVVLLHFADRSRSYLTLLKVVAIVNAAWILVAYFFKLIHQPL